MAAGKVLGPGARRTMLAVALVATVVVGASAGADAAQQSDTTTPVPTDTAAPGPAPTDTTGPAAALVAATPGPVVPSGLRPVAAPPIRVPSPLEVVNPGDTGEYVLNLQRRLTELGYWLGPADGRYSSLTSQAVMAFQKYSGMGRTGKADQATVDAINSAARPAARTTDGDVTEVDKRRQIILLVRGGKVEWVFNTSTGSGRAYTEIGTSGLPVSGVANTPDGHFAVNREIAVGWRISELGQLWRPKYFNGGIAFHGAHSVPAQPASHGCVRLTVAAMDYLWAQNYLPRGLKVWVYSD